MGAGVAYNPTAMEGQTDSRQPARVEELGRRVVAMCNTGESLFADAVVSFLADSSEMVDELRAEDYQVHDQWLQIEQLCLELLDNGPSDTDQIRFIMTAINIAGGLKRAADESMRIAEALRECELDALPQADSLPRMIELTQNMLGDVVEALLTRDAAEASALHLVFRELAELERGAIAELVQRIRGNGLAPDVGVRLAGVSQRLLRIGDEVLGISNEVAHLYRAEQGA